MPIQNSFQLKENTATQENRLKSAIFKGPDSKEALKDFKIDPHDLSQKSALPWSIEAKKYHLTQILIETYQFDVNRYFISAGYSQQYQMPKKAKINYDEGRKKGRGMHVPSPKLGYSLLLHAILSINDKAMIALLLRHMSVENKNIKTGVNHGNALHHMLENIPLLLSRNSNKRGISDAQQELLDIIKLLLEEGVKIDSQDVIGNTPLHLAMHALEGNIQDYPIDNGAKNLFKLLLDYGADPAAPNAAGQSLNVFLEARFQKGEQAAVHEMREHIQKQEQAYGNVSNMMRLIR